MANVRTFVDSGVLIAAATGQKGVADFAFAVLGDPNRLFISSDFIRLEVLPKARFHKKADEAEFYEEFFSAASEVVPASKQLVDAAQVEAETAGLQAFDALHVAAAIASKSDEIVTSEKPGETLFRTRSMTVKTIHPG
jgi:hypothetical protein